MTTPTYTLTRGNSSTWESSQVSRLRLPCPVCASIRDITNVRHAADTQVAALTRSPHRDLDSYGFTSHVITSHLPSVTDPLLWSVRGSHEQREQDVMQHPFSSYSKFGSTDTSSHLSYTTPSQSHTYSPAPFFPSPKPYFCHFLLFRHYFLFDYMYMSPGPLST